MQVTSNGPGGGCAPNFGHTHLSAQVVDSPAAPNVGLPAAFAPSADLFVRFGQRCRISVAWVYANVGAETI